MRNRFNINESEKNRIRAMHNIYEQTLPKLPEGCEACLSGAITGSTGDKYINKVNTIIIAVNDFMSTGKMPTLTQLQEVLKDIDMMDALSIGSNILECEMCMSEIDYSKYNKKMTDAFDAVGKEIKNESITEDEDLGGMTSDPRIMAREYGERIELSPTQQSIHDNIIAYVGQTFGSWMSPSNPPFSQEYAKPPYFDKLAKGIRDIIIDNVE